MADRRFRIHRESLPNPWMSVARWMVRDSRCEQSPLVCLSWWEAIKVAHRLNRKEAHRG